MVLIVLIYVINIFLLVININGWEFSNYIGIIKLIWLWIDKDVMKYFNYLLIIIIIIYVLVLNFLKDLGYFRVVRF